MQNTKPVSTALVAYFKLAPTLFPQSDNEFNHMSRVPYFSVVISLLWSAHVQIYHMH